jgi:hypothetical protein
MRTYPLSTHGPAGLGIFSLIAKALMFPVPQARVFEDQEAARSHAPATTPQLRRGLLERLDHWFWVQQQRDLEARLGKATDVYDLEARIRAIDHDGCYPRY